MRSQTLLRNVVAIAVIVGPSAVLAESSIQWRTNLDAAKIEATRSNRLLLLHFTRKSCGPCKYLDDNVFSLPHVGPAVEQQFVPVRIDADTSPALAHSFGIKQVPTEIILTPQGDVVANLPIPDKADPYLGQLQNVARHYAQSTAGAASAPGNSATPEVNSAYANLPVAKTPAPAPAAMTVKPPQTQGNPFMATAAPPQAGAPNMTAGQGTPPTASPMTPPIAQQTAQAAVKPYNPYGTMAPAMPANAMPRSYQYTAEAAAPAAPPVASSAIAATATAATMPNSSSVAVTSASPTTKAAPPAAATVAAAPTAAPAQLPPGAPPVGFEGYCPVSVKTQEKWIPGNPSIGVVHRGRTYLFAGEAERQQFWADPDAYSPVFAGLDPVLLLEKQQSVEGTRQFNWQYGGLVYFFSSEETKRRFEANPASYAAGVRQAMSRIDAVDGGVIRR
jgi:YHS domain-containing protein